MANDPGQFESLLLKTIDEVLKGCLGETNAQIIYDYLEKKACPMSEIDRKLDVFSAELGMLLGSGRGQILGSASILEQAIVEVLCLRMGIRYDSNRTGFADYVRELKEAYNRREPAVSDFKIETEVKRV